MVFNIAKICRIFIVQSGQYTKHSVHVMIFMVSRQKHVIFVDFREEMLLKKAILPPCIA